MTDRDKKLIRNSTAEFLIFTGQAGEQSIEARYDGETIWLSQRLMAELFTVDVRTISEHLKNIYETGEIQREATLRKFRRVQTEGNREVARSVDFYNLEAIISVGYRANSVRAKRLDAFLEFSDRQILQGKGKVTAESPRLTPKANSRNTVSCKTGCSKATSTEW